MAAKRRSASDSASLSPMKKRKVSKESTPANSKLNGERTPTVRSHAKSHSKKSNGNNAHFKFKHKKDKAIPSGHKPEGAKSIFPKPKFKKSEDLQKKADKGSAEKGPPSSRKAMKKMLVESRKRHHKPNFDVEKEATLVWEKMRQRNLNNEDRSRLISDTLEKMKGKIPDMASSHVASRVLQTCIKYGQAAEREVIFRELRPHFLTLARNTYAHHLVIKMVDHASKVQFNQIVTSLHGNVVAFLRHPVGSAVVEHVYNLGNNTQKQELISEFFSPEFRFFKGIVQKGRGRILDLLVDEPLSKRASILEHMALSLQPILEKGIVDHSIIHRALIEYVSVAKKVTIDEVVNQISGPLLVRMIHTKDGAKMGVVCICFGGRKELKKIVKALKGNATKAAYDENGNMVLLFTMDKVDDTKITSKCILSELCKNVKDLALHKYGRRILLHLLAPYSPRYFPSDVLNIMSNPFSFTGHNIQEDSSTVKTNQVETDSCVGGEKDSDADEPEKGMTSCNKKDPLAKRLELLQWSNLAEKLVEVCSNHAGDLIRSPNGKDVIFEVARGGADNVLWKIVPDGVTRVHKAIAHLACELPSNSDDVEEEHVLVQYHSSRTLRRLIIDAGMPPSGVETPSFAAIFWDEALKGKCKPWATGHSEKVVSAFLECSDIAVKDLAEEELGPLLKSGLLKPVSSSSSQSTKKKMNKLDE